MRPLPRLLAYLDDAIAAREDLGVGLAAIAAAGPAVALVARAPRSSAYQLTALAVRCRANAGPPEAQVYVSGRGDVALATGSQGVVARRGDLPVSELRRLAGTPPRLATLASVHTVAEAHVAVADGADGLVCGTIWPSASHPDGPVAGLDLIRDTAPLGVPVFAIGGITPDRAREAVTAGAWGVAAIGALWNHLDPHRATLDLLDAMQRQA
jgi:thiamine-phosphate diphosphorylase